jgi:hypothetical protein
MPRIEVVKFCARQLSLAIAYRGDRTRRAKTVSSMQGYADVKRFRKIAKRSTLDGEAFEDYGYGLTDESNIAP